MAVLCKDLEAVGRANSAESALKVLSVLEEEYEKVRDVLIKEQQLAR